MAGHTALPLPWRGVLQQLWVQTDAQSPQPVAPLRLWVPAALPTICLISSWITTWLFSWLLDRRADYTFLFFRKIIFRVITFWWYYLLFSIFIIKYVSAKEYICLCVCLYNTCSLKVSNKTNGHVPTTLLNNSFSEKATLWFWMNSPSFFPEAVGQRWMVCVALVRLKQLSSTSFWKKREKYK